MRQWVGLLDLLSTAQLDTSGDSGWLAWPTIPHGEKDSGAFYDWAPAMANLIIIPAGMAATDTVDLDLEIGFDSAGIGGTKLHDFTQIVNTNVTEILYLPSGASVAAVAAAVSHFPLGSHYRWVWTSANNPAGTISCYGALA